MTVQKMKEILESKLRRLFPNEGERLRAMEVLLTYGAESYEQEPERVKLAILKFSENRLAEIKKYTQYAKEDFRDILCWAEYPNQGKEGRLKNKEKKQKLKEKDRLQYEDWLKS